MNEWTHEPEHERWTDKASGYECVIQRHTGLKHLCGYVGLPASHPWHSKGYDDVMMMDSEYPDVHGGLTYAHDHEPMGEKDGLWWLGFDCAHSGDFSPGIRETLESVGSTSGYGSDETYKNWAFVKRECESLAQQAKRHANAVATDTV